jgi:hypothetical protein
MISYRKKARLFKDKVFFCRICCHFAASCGAAGWFGLISLHVYFRDGSQSFRLTGAGMP